MSYQLIGEVTEVGYLCIQMHWDECLQNLNSAIFMSTVSLRHLLSDLMCSSWCCIATPVSY